MKKLITLLSLLLVAIMMIGCASTKAGVADKAYPDELIPPAMEKKFLGNNDPNPLMKTNVKGIYVIHPHESLKDMMNSGYDYEIEIFDKKTGEFLFTIKNVITHWTGMYGWNGQVVQKDLTCVTADCLQYVIKENMYSWQMKVSTFIQAVYSENPDWTEYWSCGLPDGKSTKWKVTEIWSYSDHELTYASNFEAIENELALKIQEKIPGCKFSVGTKERANYDGWMPPNAEYALFMRLESKNCYVKDAWCETIETSLLKEVYDIMANSAKDFITNY